MLMLLDEAHDVIIVRFAIASFFVVESSLKVMRLVYKLKKNPKNKVDSDGDSDKYLLLMFGEMFAVGLSTGIFGC